MNAVNCTTCGFAVEWLRSCYAGSWRLVRGSNQLTRGYYWFCDPTTPFYPGEHNYGSRIWTTPEIINPPLGESSAAHSYRPGGLPVAQPPPVVVGSPDCFRGGDNPPVSIVGRSLPGGVDSRCYPLGAAPAPVPTLWLAASDLTGTVTGSAVGLWRDRSVYRRDPFNPDTTTIPFVDLDLTGFKSVSFALGSLLPMGVPMTLDRNWTVCAVLLVTGGLFHTGAAGVLSSNTVLSRSPLLIGPDNLSIRLNGVSLDTPADSCYDSVVLLTAQRVSGVCQLRRNGVQLVQGSAGAGSPHVANQLVAQTVISAPGGLLELIEIRVFDQALAAGQLAQVEGGLMAAYSI